VFSLANDSIIHESGHEARHWWLEGTPPNVVCYMKYGLGFTGGTIWSQDIEGLDARNGDKAELIALETCRLFRRGWHEWKNGTPPPGCPTTGYYVAEPVFGDAIAEKYGAAVFGYSESVYLGPIEAFEAEFWPMLTEQGMTIADAWDAARDIVFHTMDEAEWISSGMASGELVGDSKDHVLAPPGFD
jgi:hypothetical protein